MKIESITPEFVESIPKELKPGKLYISEKYSIAAHLCACGCGSKVITPLSPASWSIKVKGKLASLTPSIGNWNFPCKSHYWITNNAVRWARGFSEAEIKSVRQRDAIDKKNEIDQVNRERTKPTLPPQIKVETPQLPGLLESIKNWFKNIFS